MSQYPPQGPWQQPPQWQGQPQQGYQQPPQPKPPDKKPNVAMGCGVLATLIVILVLIGAFIYSNFIAPQAPTVAQQPTATLPGRTPTVKPTPTHQVVHYPPTTQADLRGLAAQGDATAIHEFHSESVGLTGVCPQPKREVTVDPSLTGRTLAEDLLAYFYAQQLDNPCGSVVFAYHNQAESGNGYTAGRILVNVTDSSGQGNIDPNATNLKYTLTLDIGDFSTGKEYVVTY